MRSHHRPRYQDWSSSAGHGLPGTRRCPRPVGGEHRLAWDCRSEPALMRTAPEAHFFERLQRLQQDHPGGPDRRVGGAKLPVEFLVARYIDRTSAFDLPPARMKATSERIKRMVGRNLRSRS